MDRAAKLVLVATPIGNLDDLSKRAISALSEADVWFVEDSRVSGKLQSVLELRKPMRILNEHTTPAGISKYVEELNLGQSGVLLTDGGCPVISDPGSLFVDACLDAGIEVDAIPGPSAVTSALMLSGFFGQRFAFLGFLPRKPGPMRSEFRAYADSSLTLVFFESPFRLTAALEAIAQELPGRRYAICREITKLHQQVFRAELPTIPSERDVPRKGEITIVVEGKRRKASSERNLDV